MTDANQKKRTAAIAYLRERGKYILDSKFVPTSSAHTDVAKTMREFLEVKK